MVRIHICKANCQCSLLQVCKRPQKMNNNSNSKDCICRCLRKQLTCIFGYDAQCFFWGSPIIGEADLILGGSSPSQKSRCLLSRFKKECRVNIGAPQKDQSSIACTLAESQGLEKHLPKGSSLRYLEVISNHPKQTKKQKHWGWIFFLMGFTKQGPR